MRRSGVFAKRRALTPTLLNEKLAKQSWRKKKTETRPCTTSSEHLLVKVVFFLDRAGDDDAEEPEL